MNALDGGRGLCGVGECHQAVWLLDFVETLQATSRKGKAVLRRAMSFLP